MIKKKLLSVWVIFSMDTELRVVVNWRKRTSVNRASPVILCDVEPSGLRTVSRSCKSQLALFTTERHREMQSGVVFFKTRLKISVN